MVSEKELSLLVLYGPNFRELGEREGQHYGGVSYKSLVAQLDEEAAIQGANLRHVQSNHEGVLIDAIHQASADGVSGIVVNAGGYSHTSVALRDAFLTAKIPFVEVHMSNTFAREEFRHRSVLADVAEGVIVGFGVDSFRYAVRHFCG